MCQEFPSPARGGSGRSGHEAVEPATTVVTHIAGNTLWPERTYTTSSRPAQGHGWQHQRRKDPAVTAAASGTTAIAQEKWCRGRARSQTGPRRRGGRGRGRDRPCPGGGGGGGEGRKGCVGSPTARRRAVLRDRGASQSMRPPSYRGPMPGSCLNGLLGNCAGRWRRAPPGPVARDRVRM